jgi:hypothetical protein
VPSAPQRKTKEKRQILIYEKAKTGKRNLYIKWLCHRGEERQEPIIYKSKKTNLLKNKYCRKPIAKIGKYRYSMAGVLTGRIE